MQKFLLILLGLVLLAPVSGELWHISVLRFDLLPSDLLIFIFFAAWVFYKIKEGPRLRLGRIGKFVVLFLFTITLTTLVNFFRFPLKEMIAAGTYLGRLGMYVILALLTFDLLFRDKKNHGLKVVLGSMTLSMVFISILGFLQLKYFPSFLELGLDVEGWDPHQGRLLSTWFDPNFIGGYLAFILGITLALALYFFRGKRSFFWIFSGASLLGLIALYYTFSRSGYLALIATVGILALLKSRKLFIAALVLALLGFALSPRVQERVEGAVQSAKVLFGVSSEYALDPTARLRVQSWSEAIEIIRDHPWIGVGYNRYPYEINQRGYGLLSDHDSGGSDSSLLTIWATTGLLGLLSYLAIGFAAAAQGIKRAWRKNDFKSYLNAGLLASFGGVMIHSIFVNSLLFSPMMVYLSVGLGLLDTRKML